MNKNEFSNNFLKITWHSILKTSKQPQSPQTSFTWREKSTLILYAISVYSPGLLELEVKSQTNSPRKLQKTEGVAQSIYIHSVIQT